MTKGEESELLGGNWLRLTDKEPKPLYSVDVCASCLCFLGLFFLKQYINNVIEHFTYISNIYMPVVVYYLLV